MTNNSDTCCKKFLSAIGYYAFIISGFIANDKFTSMAFLALNEIEDVALEWDETNEKKSIKIVKTIEKVLLVILLFNSFLYTLVEKRTAETQLAQRPQRGAHAQRDGAENIPLAEFGHE